MSIVETRYAVPGWGVGELWCRGDVVVANDFHFRKGHVQGSDPGSDPFHGSRGHVPGRQVGELIRRFRALLEGADVTFDDVAVDLEWATPLQRELAHALRAVPRGEVVSYGELAALAGRPRAPRAAGAFCSANRFSFIVPCHRVIAANGIGSYGGAGVEIKRRLLALEGIAL